MARKSETTHNQMISAVVNSLRARGYIKIKADHIGGTQPDQINWKNGTGHIPDIQAEKDGKVHIFEVETEDSIEDAHTADQFRLFSAAAREWGTHIFHIVVPKTSEYSLRFQLSALGISNATVWTA